MVHLGMSGSLRVIGPNDAPCGTTILTLLREGQLPALQRPAPLWLLFCGCRRERHIRC